MRPLSRGLLLAMFVGVPAPAAAYNNRSECKSNFHWLAQALRNYQQHRGTLPTDILDPQGRPLLSWRVRLLPYLVGPPVGLRLDEPWDSPHNRKVLDRTPPAYYCPGSSVREGLTTYFLVRGPGTAFPDDQPGARRLEDLPPTTAVLVEGDEEHAVPWTKPADWHFDPAAPRAGLGRQHWGGFPPARGGFAVFADGQVRFLPETADEALLRAIFTGDGGQHVRLRIPWYEAVLHRPLVGFVVPYALLGLCAVIGGVWVVLRLLRCEPVSPGEMLWLVVGAAFAAHAVAVVRWYAYEPLPTLGPDDTRFWYWPSFAATVASLAGVVKFRSSPAWFSLFLINTIFLSLFTLDAEVPYQHRRAEESFATASSPIWMAFIALAAAWLTLSSKGVGAWAGRKLPHWAGIGVALLPFLLCVGGCVLGVAAPRAPFVRVLD
jgi:hypothetical protein